jgi:GxxExxY protein
MDVLNEMKPGLDEKLYERAMVIELKKRGHNVDVQKGFPVFYYTELIGNLVPDLIIDEKVIVDPKVVASFNEAHVAQRVGYLAARGSSSRYCSTSRAVAWNGNVLCDKRSRILILLISMFKSALSAQSA